jgi:hypothetical protein
MKMFETIFREYPTAAYAVLVITTLLVFVVLAGGIAALNLTMTTLAGTQRMMERYSDSIVTRDREIGLLIEENKRIRADSDPEAVPDTDKAVPETEPCDGEGDLCYDDVDSMAHPTKATLEAIKAAEKLLGGNHGTWRNIKISIPPNKQPAKCVCPDTTPASVLGVMGAYTTLGPEYASIDSLDGVTPFVQPIMLYADAKLLLEPLHTHAPINSDISGFGDWWCIYIGARGSNGNPDACADLVSILVPWETFIGYVVPFANGTLSASDSIPEGFSTWEPNHSPALTCIELIASTTPPEPKPVVVPESQPEPEPDSQITLLPELDSELIESSVGDIVLGANLGSCVHDTYTDTIRKV